MTPPPSREPAPDQAGVTDAEAQEWEAYAQKRPVRFADVKVLRLLRDRARYQERIETLEAGLRDQWTVSALLHLYLGDILGGPTVPKSVITEARDALLRASDASAKTRALLGEVPDAT